MQNELNSTEIAVILERFLPQQEQVIKALHELQNAHPRHYISEDILNQASKYFNLTKAQLYGIVTYYSMFSVTPRGKYLIRLCKSPVCQMMGADKLVKQLTQKWNLEPDKTSEDGLFTLELCECLGRCGKAPSMTINEAVFSELTNEKLDEILLNIKQSEK